MMWYIWGNVTSRNTASVDVFINKMISLYAWEWMKEYKRCVNWKVEHHGFAVSNLPEHTTYNHYMTKPLVMKKLVLSNETCDTWGFSLCIKCVSIK